MLAAAPSSETNRAYDLGASPIVVRRVTRVTNQARTRRAMEMQGATHVVFGIPLMRAPTS
jgi:hypothetical protein